MDLILPEPYQHQLLQQKLDRSVEKRLSEYRKQEMAASLPEEQKTASRKRTGHFTTTVDVQIQQVQQQEVMQENSVEFVNMLERGDNDEVAYTIDTFRDAWQAGLLAIEANSQYLDSSRQQAHQLWCNWVGAFNRRAAILSKIKITKSACHVLMQYHEQFQFGVDFKNLPAGFLLIEKSDELILDFDLRLKRVAKSNPLAITLIDKPVKAPLLHEHIDKLVLHEPLDSVWKRLNQEPYSKKANQLFRQHLPTLRLLDSDAMRLLWNLTDGMLNAERFQFLLDTAIAINSSKTPPKQNDPNLLAQLKMRFGEQEYTIARNFLFMYSEQKFVALDFLDEETQNQINGILQHNDYLDQQGLLQLYLQFGNDGLQQFENYLQSYPLLSQYLFINSQNYAICLQPEFSKALDSIDKFSGTTKIWWDVLFQQHCAAHTNIDLFALVKAFQYFKRELYQQLGDVELPENCDFKDIKNSVTCLSRMLTILKHVEEKNRMDQLEIIAELDFSSTGAIQLVHEKSSKRWAFITPEMQISANDTDIYLNPEAIEYTVPTTCKFKRIYSSIVDFGFNIIREPNGEPDITLPYLSPGSYIYSYNEHDFIHDSNQHVLEVTSSKGLNYCRVSGLSEVLPNISYEEKLDDKILGETWEDYIDRITRLMNDKKSTFIKRSSQLQDQLKLTGHAFPHLCNNFFSAENVRFMGYKTDSSDVYDPSYVYGYQNGQFLLLENYTGINIHFMSTKPILLDNTYDHSLIYVRPYLYRVNEKHELEKLSLRYIPAELESYIENRIQKQRELFQKRYPQADSDKLAKFNFKFETLGSHEITSWFLDGYSLYYKMCDLLSAILNESRIKLDYTAKQFFRYAAYQQWNKVIPLCLCQHIHKKISEQTYSDALKHGMYQMLAASLEHSLEYLDDLEKIKAIIDEIIKFEVSCYRIEDELDEIRRQRIEKIFDFNYIPPLPFLKTILNFTDIHTFHPKFFAFMNRSPKSIYKGMRDYIDDDYEKYAENKNPNPHSLSDYMSTAFEFENLLTNISQEILCLDDRTRIRDYLCELIGKFQLKFLGYEKIHHFCTQNKQGILIEALDILRNLNFKGSGLSTQLTQANFEAILDGLMSTQQSVKTYLEGFYPNENPLSDYFPAKKIQDPLQNHMVPFSVRSKIMYFFTHEELQQQLKKFIIQFGDANYYADCIDLIIKLYKKIDLSERDVFIKMLLDAKGLYFPVTTLNPDYSRFMQLLDDIDKLDQHDILSYFLYAEQLLRESNGQPMTEDLSDRVLLYTQKINPKMSKIPLRSLSDLELTPRITATLLKTPVAEFHREGCSLHFCEDAPSMENLDSLYICHHAAYIYSSSDKNLYYVNKVRHKCEKLELTSDQKNLFEDNFKYEYPTLSAEQLQLLSQYHPHTDDYSANVNNLYMTIDALIKRNSGVTEQFLELYDNYQANYNPDNGDLIDYLQQLITKFDLWFEKIPNKNTVISLCFLFKDNANCLLTLLEALPSNEEVLFTQIAIAAASHEESFDLEAFCELCAIAKENLPLMELLKDYFYNFPPYPSLKSVLDWHKNSMQFMSQADEGYQYKVNMAEKYSCYDKNPFHRSDDNGFKLAKAEMQLLLIKKDIEPYDAQYFDIQRFATISQELRNKTTLELLNNFNNFKSIDDLVAVAAELLYRSTGIELNTTQYLSLLTMLKTPGHVTSQIATSEGKSRLMMISCVCQYAMGKTVDFVTSDMHLSARDFVEYQAYFDLVRAPTKLIYADTYPESYQKRGINFSDPTNLILLRNRARSMQKSHLVIDDNEERRCLQLDEADKTYFDSANSRHNYSDSGDPLLRDMPWVYSLLVAYFLQKSDQYDPLDLFHNDIDSCRDKFLIFAKSHFLCLEDESRIDRLESLPNEKIEEWQTMAFIAMQQKFLRDFDIRPDQLIQTDKKLKMSSETVLIINNNLAEHSKLSFGTDQCQKAYLNYLRQNPDKNTDPALRQALSECHYAFHVPDEKQIIYSSTSKNFLDDYAPGEIKAVTGSPGAIIERIEARQLYKSSVNALPMTFIDMPRERGLHRRDKAIYLAANASEQFEAIVTEITLAVAKKQPVLIIAEDSCESKQLYDDLLKRFDSEHVQLVDLKLSAVKRAACIQQAGYPEQITVSTGTLGRGTDISLTGDSKVHGLMVINTFLPSERDQLQFAGRSARYGQKGDYIVILDKSRLKKALGKTTLTDGFYTHTEDYIRHELAKMDKRSQLNRLLQHTVGDYRKKLTDHFFAGFVDRAPNLNLKQVLPLWSSFFAKSDRIWNLIHPEITQALADSRIEDAENLLNKYQEKTFIQWTVLQNNVASLHLSWSDFETNKIIKGESLLDNPVNELKFSDEIKALLAYKPAQINSLKKIKFYDNYAPAHDGRAVKYTRWYIPLIASLKGWANLIPGVNFTDARRPFANFRAWLDGRGQLFADFRASKNKALIIVTGIAGLLALATGVVMFCLSLWIPTIACIIIMVIGAGILLSITSGISTIPSYFF